MDAEARLLGAKYDSLPSLLQKSLDREDADPIVRYVTFLCAKQLRDWVAKTHRTFLRERRERANNLDSLLAKLPEVRQTTLPQGTRDDHAFLDWYEPAFLRELVREGRRE